MNMNQFWRQPLGAALETRAARLYGEHASNQAIHRLQKPKEARSAPLQHTFFMRVGRFAPNPHEKGEQNMCTFLHN